MTAQTPLSADPIRAGWSPSQPVQSGTTDLAAMLLVEEYKALKAEQSDRIRTRDNLVYTTLAAIAAVVFGAYQADRLAFLLAVPLVCAALGWIRVANDRKVNSIRNYLRDHTAVRLEKIVGQPVFAWESPLPRSRLGSLTRILADLAIVVVPSIFAVGVAGEALAKSGQPGALWAMLAIAALAPLVFQTVSERR